MFLSLYKILLGAPPLFCTEVPLSLMTSQQTTYFLLAEENYGPYLITLRAPLQHAPWQGETTRRH